MQQALPKYCKYDQDNATNRLYSAGNLIFKTCMVQPVQHILDKVLYLQLVGHCKKTSENIQACKKCVQTFLTKNQQPTCFGIGTHISFWNRRSYKHNNTMVFATSPIIKHQISYVAILVQEWKFQSTAGPNAMVRHAST